MSKSNMSGVVALSLVVGLLTVSAPARVQADAATEATPAVLRVVKTHSVRKVKFDWLADRSSRIKPIPVADVQSPRQIGSGSWICSPAGFGKKSRCYAN